MLSSGEDTISMREVKENVVWAPKVDPRFAYLTHICRPVDSSNLHTNLNYTFTTWVIIIRPSRNENSVRKF